MNTQDEYPANARGGRAMKDQRGNIMTAGQARANTRGGGSRQRTGMTVAALLLTAALAGCGSAAGPADDGAAASSPSGATADAGTAQAGNDTAGASGPSARDAGGEDPSAGNGAGDARAAAGGAAEKEPASEAAADGKDAAAGKAAAAKDVPKTAKDAVHAENARITGKEKAFAEDIGEDGGVAIAAVVELGHEACDRLAYLKTADASLIPGALASGEIANTEEAITNLCPEFTAQLKTAQAGFGDGRFRVKGASGENPVVAAGTYVAATPTEHCSWQVLDRKGRVLATGGNDMVNGASGDHGQYSMTVAHSAASVVSNGCYAWLPKG